MKTLVNDIAPGIYIRTLSIRGALPSLNLVLIMHVILCIEDKQ